MTCRLRQSLAPCALLLAIALPACAALAAEQRLGEHLYLVRDKPGTPTRFQMVVGAGCIDEAGGECRGLAHYLEHLILSGRNSEHKEVALRFFPGGYSNGWTSRRATVYVHSMPARAEGPRADLERLFAFYAARLKNLTVSDADAERERNVVRQEHDWRIASKPFVVLARKLDRLLIPDHPAGQWVIGTAEDIDRFTLDDVHAFHRVWYAINNVDFVVMADVDPATLKGIADRALAGLGPRTLPPRASLKPPALVNGRVDVIEQDGTIHRPAIIFKKLVRVAEEDATATAAASTVVTNFLTSRLPGSLYDVVVDQGRLAAGTPSVSLSRVGPKSFELTIGADAALDVAPETLLAAVGNYVEQLAAAGLPSETQARLKTRFAESRAAADSDPQQVYNRLVAWLANRGRYEQLATWPQRVAAVTPAQVTLVLKALSGPGRVATGILVPTADRQP
jgi:zinc protease